ncbi:hypothetical protein Rsub_08875 [Raphidocelis subcapitata]|uniref:RRM Nup35-type domain-containing protein n=1 Tax=Raphidocelis subcapitata TaxID=307507 RepID=A0A2V0PFZ6_9CHLO|nr:hypothetical protein Rsub_08875 [Raphidocelis subcapitata]|eukprot:GBF96127.1 hypothetical protein Rsub_08875 [Raphidocelis subcapitata]
MSQITGEFPPLLFTLPSELPAADYRTPNKATPLSGLARGESSLSQHTRRSLTPPGSVHTESTPPRPPPILRLQDSLTAEADGLGASPPEAAAAAAPPPAAPRLLPVDSPHALDDTWVTVYGFPPEELASVLREFQACGDVLQWGSFGAGAGANFVHIQYQTRYGAQRAMLRGGEQLSATLIVGVKPLDPRHRQLVEAAGGGPAAAGSPDGLRVGRGGGAAAAVRPYRVEAAAAAALPQRGTGLWQKLSQFVIGA